MTGDAVADQRLVGHSASIRAINTAIEAAARSPAKVLITGETGVGKEIVARLIHARSARRLARLVPINCAGVPDSLLESELFGHVRGSFTGAYRDNPGLLAVAAHGTVFLDEVAEMSVRMQTMLLRFLETGELQRVGADRVVNGPDVRVIAATNRDLLKEISVGTFREDLFYRLNVVPIHVPPLRERRIDIPALLDHFLAIYSRCYEVAPPVLTPTAMDWLVGYGWPGNVRELRNVVERLVIGSPGAAVGALDLPAELRAALEIDSTTGNPGMKEPSALLIAQLVARMVERGESFWATVHPLFMNRDLTRDQLREVVCDGLERASGNYRRLTQLFNIPSRDYRRFMGFLRKHDCCLSSGVGRILRQPPVLPTRTEPHAEAGGM
jgi:DNA-binding NtrC family response regulator